MRLVILSPGDVQPKIDAAYISGKRHCRFRLILRQILDVAGFVAEHQYVNFFKR